MRKRILKFCVLAVIVAVASNYRAVMRVFLHLQQAAAFQLNFNLAYHNRKEEAFEALPARKCNILFLGDSHTANHNWQAQFPAQSIVERGIVGDMTQGIAERLPEVCRHSPEVIILEGGINNLSRGDTPPQVVSSIQEIVTEIHRRLPQSKIVLESLYPVNNRVALETNTRVGDEMNALVLQVNASLKTMTDVQYVDVHSHLLDGNHILDRRYTLDGVHLTADGYKIIATLLSPYVKPPM